MAKQYKFLFLVVLFHLHFATFSASIMGNNTRIELKWNNPTLAQEENYPISFLSFDDAHFADSLLSVPVFITRVQDVPHFRTVFAISEEEVVPCSPEEISILEEAGYLSGDFYVSTDQDITRGDSYSRFHIIPIRYREGQYEKLVSFELKTETHYAAELKYKSTTVFPETSVLSAGEWFRVCVEKEGIYRLTNQNLVELGLNPAQIEKSTIQLFGNGGGMLPEANSAPFTSDLIENAIWISGSNSGSFSTNDYILFYGQSPHRWQYQPTEDIFTHQLHHYSNETCYFLTFGQRAGKRVEIANNINDPHTHTVTNFYDYVYHHRENFNLIKSGKEWLGESFEPGVTQNFAFSFPDIDTQTPVHVRISAVARSSNDSWFTVRALNQNQNLNISKVTTSSSTNIYANKGIMNFRSLPQGNNINVSLEYTRTASGGLGWLQFIALNARRNLLLNSNQLFFRNPSVVGANHISRYEISNTSGDIMIWDITHPHTPVQQSVSLQGNMAFFKAESQILKEYVAFRQQEFQSPLLRGRVPKQNLHGKSMHDLVIVVPEFLIQEAERLAEFRKKNDGLSVLVVTTQQVYNEFSSGVPDIAAIRNFMRMFYVRAADNNEYPRYLLLFGNGTFDNRNRLGYGGNLIPTFQTHQSFNHATSYLSDDFFGLLDNSEGQDAFGALDIGIGRFPVRTLEEARFVVDKVLRYDQRIEGLFPGTDDPRFAGAVANYSDWRNVISLVADDGDGNLHLNDIERIANSVENNHPVYNLRKIYLDAYQQVTLAGGSRYPDVNKAIYQTITQGTLLINYIGHGGVKGLAQERILTFDDILSWNNYYNLPIFMTATCEFSSFDQLDPNDLSAGIRIFLKPGGGAIALFTTTRLAWSHQNFLLNNAFMNAAFKPMPNGEMPRLGDLIRMAKVESLSSNSLKNFVLVGDPSMQMAYPSLKAVTTSWPDTMKAFEKVTIAGYITDAAGNKMDDYQGTIYPTVFDKPASYRTLGNDPGSYPLDFTMQNRIIYKGTAQIENGEYSFSFVVPRDISYNSGIGKISYYFDDGITDGNGYFSNFVVSGTADEYAEDNTGPEIRLFMDHTSFQSGDKTGPNPILLALLHDENGINTTGNIGHDIVAFLNGNTSNPIVLNSFYLADKDTYKSGRVVFPFYNLDEGDYTLSLRVWDTHNNVSVESIDFVVTSAPGIAISDLINFPNPFDVSTRFKFSHNKPATELHVLIDIFSLNGQLVKTIETHVYASGFEIPPIEWDGTDEGGNILKNGIYIFRAQVATLDGDKVAKSERLVILR